MRKILTLIEGPRFRRDDHSNSLLACVRVWVCVACACVIVNIVLYIRHESSEGRLVVVCLEINSTWFPIIPYYTIPDQTK